MWKHKDKYKNKIFLGTYELNKSGKRIFKLKDANSGKELGPFSSPSNAKQLGFLKIK